MNGNVAEKYLSNFDPDDPEYQRQLLRPAEVKEDVKLMEQRKRVSLILSSEAFREELEQMIESQLCSGSQPASLLALQQIADALQIPRGEGQRMPIAAAGAGPLPINDIRGVESLNYSKGERLLRCKLASTCRLLDLFGWTLPTPGSVKLSARVGGDRDGFLATPTALLAHEVTASSLLKLDAQGSPANSGNTPFGPAMAWQTLDGPLYASRPAIRCVLQLRTPATVALSAARSGLLPLTVETVACGHVPVLDQPNFQDAQDAHVMLVRNIGLVCCGESVEETFYYAQRAVQACETQLAALTLGGDQLCVLGDAQCESVRAALDAQLAALPKADNLLSTSQSQSLAKSDGSEAGAWLVGELEFEAFMRYLDNAGFRTGYPYRIPVVKHGHGHKAKELQTETELPPTVSCLADEMQQFELAHGSGRATQLLKEVSAAKKSATLPAGGFRKQPKSYTLRPTPSNAEQHNPSQLLTVSTVSAAESAQSAPASPDKTKVAVAVSVSPPSVVVNNSAAPSLARAVSARTPTQPLANENAPAANSGAELRLSTPIGSATVSASTQRPLRSKSERYPSGASKPEVKTAEGARAADEEDGSGKKEKKKEKSGLFSFSKKKEKAK